jgi:hypothetical protein
MLESRAEAMEHLDECYSVSGTGGLDSCIAVQEKLQAYGLCGYTRWEPDPRYQGAMADEFSAHWRFFYETNLKRAEAIQVLGSYATRYNVQLM